LQAIREVADRIDCKAVQAVERAPDITTARNGMDPLRAAPARRV